MLPRLPRSHLDLLSLAIEFLRFSQTFVVNNLLLLQLQGGQGLLLQLCELHWAIQCQGHVQLKSAHLSNQISIPLSQPLKLSFWSS